MQITNIRTDRVRPKRSVGTVSTVKEIDRSTCILVTIEASNGATGVGEIPDIEHPEEISSLSTIEAEMSEFLVGEDPRRTNHLTERMYDAIDLGPFDFHSFQQLALGAIDLALYDLLGREYDVPVYQLLGGKTRDVPVSWVIYSERDTDRFAELRAEVETRVDQGFQNFKLKVGEDDTDVDQERIRTVREIAGNDATILVDAQGVWTMEEALERIPKLSAAGADGVETPAGHPDRSVESLGSYYDIPVLPDELRTVRKAVDIPVLEHVLDPAFGLELAQQNAVDVFTVEACAGGLARAQQVLQIADAADIEARLGSTIELEPGTMAGASLAASAPAVTYPSDLIGPLVYEDSVVDEPISYEDGCLRLPDKPGFGLSVRSELV